ncbi:MAG: DUF3999 domain-containing protein [Acidobacteriia bacterium]|nr:DUF3999 domain-containing protein [Terriglobia bacterium]
MNAKQKVLIGIILLILSSALLVADFELTHWKYFKGIQLPGVSSKQIVSVSLDNELISHTASLEREVRLIEGEATEVAFNLVADNDEILEENQVNVAMVNKAVLGEKYQQFICDLGAGGRVTNRLVLETSSHNFVRRAEVEGSEDGRKWLSLAKGLHIFDWSEGRRLKLEFPDSTYRFLKVVLWLEGGVPLDIQGAAVSRHEKISGELEPVPVALHSHQLQTPQKFSEWLFDFGHDRPLVNRCTFDVSNPNFRRRVDLSVSEDITQWQPGPALEIFRTTSGEFKDEFTTLETNPLNHRYLRIRVMNGDDRPLGVTAISFRRFVRRVVFEFNPAQTYRLFYGNPAAQHPSYDLTAMESRSGPAVLSKGSLARQQSNPSYLEPRERLPWSERHPRLLWAVLLIVVLLLGTLLIRSAKLMGKKS